jgi:hypothetical protein
MTQCEVDKCYSSGGIDDDCKGSSAHGGILDYDIRTASILERYGDINTGKTGLAFDTCDDNTKDRTITREQLYKVVNELEGLAPDQKRKLSYILLKYQGSLTKRPGKCKNFEYKFQVNGQLPKFNYSRPIPFALRQTVSDEILQLMEDSILEESHSAYINPLTVVQRDGKRPRICVDARKINQITLPDRAKVAPMQDYEDSTELNTSHAGLKQCIPASAAGRRFQEIYRL